jgi:hypothetical protein
MGVFVSAADRRTQMPVPESTAILREQLEQARQELAYLRRRLNSIPRLKVRHVMQTRACGYYMLPILDVRMTEDYAVFDVIVGGHD